MYIDILYRDI
jgi:hypothetical protein